MKPFVHEEAFVLARFTRNGGRFYKQAFDTCDKRDEYAMIHWSDINIRSNGYLTMYI